MDITKMKQEFMDAVTGARETTIKEAGEPRQLCNEKVFPAAVKLGYLDMCRTCSGIGKKISDEPRKDIFDAIGTEIKVRMEKSDSIADQKDFDEIHEKLCQFCTEQFKKYDYSITYGQAQKIINMAFKYLYCCNDAEKYEETVFSHCHMPLDSFILKWCSDCKLCEKCSEDAWSKLEKDKYVKIQQGIRAYLNQGNTYNVGGNEVELPKTVLAAEFIIWPEEARRKSLKELKNLLKKLGEDKYFVENISEDDRKALRESMKTIIKEK